LEIEHFNFEQNYFELFDLPVGCELDASKLRQSFMELQRQYHPDRYAAAPDAERRRVVQIAAHVNGAHQTLQVPLKRAEYCLQLAGYNTDAETDSKMDPMFLMQQMELRESLEDVTAAAKPYDALDAVRSEIDELTQSIAKQASDSLQEERYDQARERVRRWQFLEKLSAEADSIEARLDDA